MTTTGFGFCDHEGRDYIENRAGEIIAWRCRRCSVTRAATEGPIDPHQAAECEWCGDSLPADARTRPTNTAMMRWIYRRFCSRECYNQDLDDRQETGRTLSPRELIARNESLSIAFVRNHKQS